MRYPAAEKLEIIRLVEQSPLPVRHTLAKLGIPRATFYRWYDRYSRGGPEALNGRSPRPDRVWNRIPDRVRDKHRPAGARPAGAVAARVGGAFHRYENLFRVRRFDQPPTGA